MGRWAVSCRTGMPGARTGRSRLWGPRTKSRPRHRHSDAAPGPSGPTSSVRLVKSVAFQRFSTGTPMVAHTTRHTSLASQLYVQRLVHRASAEVGHHMIAREGVGVPLTEVLRHPLPEDRQPHDSSIPPQGVGLAGTACRYRFPPYGRSHGRNRSIPTPLVVPCAHPAGSRRTVRLADRARAGAAPLRVPLPGRGRGRGGDRAVRLPQRRRRVRPRARTRSARAREPAAAHRARAACPGLDRALRRTAGGTRVPLSDVGVHPGRRPSRGAPQPAWLPGGPVRADRRRPAQ